MINAKIYQIITVFISLIFSLVVCEILIRVKNSNGKNYNIEMWKYSRDLKRASGNKRLGHEHLPSSSATLQNTEIRINALGMRGPDVPVVQENTRRILFLGSSATLGWGVAEKDTMTSRLQHLFMDNGKNVLVLNAGIGNYNTSRYVELFLTRLTQLDPTDIVVNYYINDVEILEQGGGNILLRNSQIAVSVWILFNRFFRPDGKVALIDHYRQLYKNGHPGFVAMKDALKRLAQYAREKGIRIYLMMMPEVHQYKNYQYGFVHDTMREISIGMGYTFVDALPYFASVKDAQELWALPGDPHPNALAHRLFAEGLYPVLLKNSD